MEKGAELAKQGKTPGEIHQELINPDDRFKSIKNPNQSRYFVQQEARKKRHFQSAKNIADEIAIVQNMFQNHNYQKWIQKIVWNKERRMPVVIMYTDDFLLGKCSI